MCHRPADTFSADVSLFYRDFDTFVCDCNSLPLEKEDTTFDTKLTISMSGYYYGELDQTNKIHDLLGNYLIGNLLHVEDNMDFSVRYGDSVALIGQIRTEVGLIPTLNS